MGDDLIADLRELLAKATPGPWECVGTDPNEGWDGYRIVGARITEERMSWGDIGTVTGPQSNPTSGSDAALIVAAVNALPALLDAHAQLTAEAEAMRSNLEKIKALRIKFNTFSSAQITFELAQDFARHALESQSK